VPRLRDLLGEDFSRGLGGQGATGNKNLGQWKGDLATTWVWYIVVRICIRCRISWKVFLKSLVPLLNERRKIFAIE
jgi:hypothetical protein